VVVGRIEVAMVVAKLVVVLELDTGCGIVEVELLVVDVELVVLG